MLSARQRACLDAMGIDLWSARAGAAVSEPGVVHQTSELGPDSRSLSPDPAPERSVQDVPTPTNAPSGGVFETEASPAIPESRVEPDAQSDGDAAALDWPELADRVRHCRACDLHQTRTQTVFGVGDQRARLLIVGEAPGADEDRVGEPFVGRAGRLLNAMLAAIGFSREQVYIANIIKCRPPGNRDPHVEEAAACQGYLHRQISLIKPALILSIGRVSAHNLLQSTESVGRLRGRPHRFSPGDIPLIVTYHPAYLLRRPLEKSKVWEDLQAAYKMLSES